tara:strand:+ start:387 stop:557 length:171 start_codon:yes stop_codon:yes gene_type:complete
MSNLVTTYDDNGAILAKYIFNTWSEATDFIANYDLTAGNISTNDVVKVTLEKGENQ